MPYKRPDVAFNGLFSSSFDGTLGVITTTGTDELIQCKDAAGVAVQGGTIAIEFITACDMNFDSDTGYHHFVAGEKISMDRNSFDAIRIQTIGSQVRFWGMSI
jgi:Ethanolamine utilization protein EutJ (predicted chaperonin)